MIKIAVTLPTAESHSHIVAAVLAIQGEISKDKHTRVIVHGERFMAKARIRI